MKSNRKIKIVVLIILGIFFAFSSIISINLSLNNLEFCSDNGNLKISAVSGKIHIDGNLGWAAFRAAGNCTGSGIYSDPYVIEELIIDGGSSGRCILIENSNVFFRIENCTVYNSGTTYEDAGIRLNFVENGILYENNCSNNYRGIYLWNSDNNTLIDNNAWNSFHSGIDIRYSDNNNILGNKVWNSTLHEGIGLQYSSNNNITGNEAWNNTGVGIWVGRSGSNDNTLIGNDVWENKWGIILESSYNSTVSGNNAWNQLVGIGLEDSNNNLISDNNAWNNTVGGYWSNASNDNTLIGNEAWENEWGYLLHDSDNNNLTENDAWNNSLDGILLWIDTNNNYLTNNNVWDNNRTGIVLSDAYQTVVTGNEAWNNSNAGFYVGDNSRSNNLLGNNAWNNFHGILLNSSINETLMSNIVSNNNKSGIYLCNSTQNFLSFNNLSSNYEYGIYIDENSTDNEIWLNFLNDNIISQAFDNGTGNMWDNGFAGNYWGDYLVRYPGASDIGGIWDIPYDIPGNTGSADNYPLVLPILVDLFPTAQITANTTQIKSGEWVQFNDASIGGNAPLSYQWNFGDGTVNSTEKNPTHQFTSPGNYTVILTVTDLDGDSDVLIKIEYIIVLQEPAIAAAIPGYILFFLIGVICVISVIISYKIKKFNS